VRAVVGNGLRAGEVLRKLATQKESWIEEGHLMPDHVHMMISIPPKYAVSQVVGCIKRKSFPHHLTPRLQHLRGPIGCITTEW